MSGKTHQFFFFFHSTRAFLRTRPVARGWFFATGVCVHTERTAVAPQTRTHKSVVQSLSPPPRKENTRTLAQPRTQSLPARPLKKKKFY